ncbi:MAG: barstar family protein [Deltaproteobacteria bacterium]|nr:MAG: barstar family protein [Deltaproteobacteria bacterium]
MAIKTGTFEYTDSQDSMCEQDDFVLRVPGGIRSKAELLAALASAGRFPDYFGGNWDALQDCLRDLSWISNRKVVIMHSDLPLHDSPAECRTYLEILQTALAEWAESVKPNAAEPPPEWSYVDHELRVVFPTEAKAAVARLVART